MKSLTSIKRNLAAGTALVAASVFGYGRAVYAQCAYSGPGPTYLCQNTPNAGQVITADDATVTTAAGFGNVVADVNSISITGDGQLSFTDANASVLSVTSGGYSALNINVTGDTGNPGGIYVNANSLLYSASGRGVTLTSGAGASGAVDARFYGSGIYGYGTQGIFARTYGASMDILTGTGTLVKGNTQAINARNQGSGSLTITAGDHVAGTGAASTGIYARNDASATSLNVTTAAGYYVRGGFYGILANNFGSGNTGVYANGNVYSTTAEAIRARNLGAGNLTVTANGTVNSAGSRGIYAYNAATGGDLNVTTGAGSSVTGNTRGIHSYNLGTGAHTFTINGDVYGTTQQGIFAVNYGTDLSLMTGAGTTVQGNLQGILARNDGSGTLTVTTGAGSYVTGGTLGLYARNNGTGISTLTINGDVTGTTQQGLHAYSGTMADDMTITTAAGTTVQGGTRGIQVTSDSYKSLAINANGDVTGGTGEGIYARNTGNGLNLSVTTGAGYTVQGNRGMYVVNEGTGTFSVTANGDVTGTGNSGIFARTYGTTMSVATGAGTTLQGTYGLIAQNFGSSSATITLNGDVTGTTGAGVYFETQGTSTDASITSAAGTTVMGNTIGIYAKNSGLGMLSVNAYGDVTGTTSEGISASNFNGTSLSITAANVTGNRGIFGYNNGTGSLTVTTTGNVTAAGSHGIYLMNYNAAGGNVSVTTGGTVHSDSNAAIFVYNLAASSVTINANEAATTTAGGVGIYARNGNLASTDISITSEAVSGHRGIIGDNYGTGSVTITANGDVTASTNIGIFAHNYAGTDISITSQGVSGVNFGIYAKNRGTGSTSVNANGDVTASFVGIGGYSYGTDLSITTAAGTTVQANQGIVTRSYGGSATITANSNVVGGAGAGHSGILAYNPAGGSSLSVTVGGASAVSGYDGVIARNYGTGGLSVTVNGDVTGTGADGISSVNAGGDEMGITIASGASVSGVRGIYIYGNNYASPDAIVTAGDITGTGGTAIYLDNLTQVTGLKINGGTITGNVIDAAPTNGFSNVTVGGNFSTGGNFDVSSLTVTGGNIFGIMPGHNVQMYSMPASAGTFNIGVTSTASFGGITVTNGAIDLSAGAITINVISPTLSDGDIMMIGDGSAPIIGGPGGTLTTVADNSVLFDFEIADGTLGGTDDTDLFLFVSSAAASLPLTGQNADILAVIQGLSGSADPNIQNALANIGGAPDIPTLNALLNALQAPVDTGAPQTLNGFSAMLFNLFDDYLSNLLSGTSSGVSSGNGAYGVNTWAQGFGQLANQGGSGASPGYDARTAGFAMGVEAANVMDNGVLGLSLAYGRSKVDSDNANNTQTDIDSYQLSVYANRAFKNRVYLRGMAGFAWSDIGMTRYNVGGGGGPTAVADFSALQYSTRFELGRKYEFGDGMITPNLSFNWLHYSPDAYNETGAGGLNLSVRGKDMDIAELGLGVKTGWKWEDGEGNSFRPSLRLGYRYDLVNDNVEATSTFAGGGAAFSSQGVGPSRHTFNAGTTLTYETSSNVEFQAAYDFDLRDDYTSHAATLKTVIKF